MPFSYIRHNLERVSATLAEVAARRGTPPATLVAVTKSASDEEVLALAALGVSSMAENRVPCYLARRDLLAAHGFAPALHLIGSLQTNKVKYIARDVALIQSLDSLHLAAEIEKQGTKAGRKIPVLIEVNSACEAAKGGLAPEEVADFAAALSDFSHLAPRGLMTMGPVCEDEEDYRPYFRRTREICDRLAARGLLGPTPILSMGMSDSYRVAAEEGATLVRVGRTLFHRPE